MNREALDEFFARADDVLTDWQPSDDAMVARAVDEDAELPLADSYYAQTPRDVTLFTEFRQRWIPSPPVRGFRPSVLIYDEAQLLQTSARAAEQMRVGMERLSRECATASTAMRAFIDAWSTPQTERDEATARRRALESRKNRNTGPRSRVGLDGHFRR